MESKKSKYVKIVEFMFGRSHHSSRCVQSSSQGLDNGFFGDSKADSFDLSPEEDSVVSYDPKPLW